MRPVRYMVFTLRSWLPRRFSLATAFWMLTVAAVGFAWHRDHVKQQAEFSKTRGELLNLTKVNSDWGVEQLVGPPDTPRAGDCTTAWASALADGQAEWVIVEFADAVRPAMIEVHETFNPGALTKASIIDALGREIVIWQGIDPTPPSAAQGVSKIPVNTFWTTRRVKLYLDSQAVPGWNEIDAVSLRAVDGRTQWVQNATASSAYGGRESNRTAYSSSPFVFTVPVGY